MAVKLVKENLNEGNPLTRDLPPSVDEFLMDLAQEWGYFNYSDILKHKFTEEDIKKLKSLRRKYIDLCKYDDDVNDSNPVAVDIVTKVADIVLAEVVEEDIKSNDRREIIFQLKKIKTEATEALYKFEQMDDPAEALSILRFIHKDSEHMIDMLKRVTGLNESCDETLEEKVGGMSAVLDSIRGKLDKELPDGWFAKRNHETSCIDIYKGSKLIYQVYPEQVADKVSKRTIYRKAEEGEVPEYVKDTVDGTLSQFTSEDLYYKKVSRTYRGSFDDLINSTKR